LLRGRARAHRAGGDAAVAGPVAGQRLELIHLRRGLRHLHGGGLRLLGLGSRRALRGSEARETESEDGCCANGAGHGLSSPFSAAHTTTRVFSRQLDTAVPKRERRGMAIPTRPLGSTGGQVSIVGLGGYHLGIPSLAESQRMVHAAL